MAEKENVVTQTYDFLKYLTPVLDRFPRSQKFLLADRMQVKVMDVLDLFLEAYYTKDREKKRGNLLAANLKLEQLRYLVRLANDLRCINSDRYEVISKKVNEIGKQLGGWLKTLG